MPTATAEAAGTGSREHRPPTRPQGLLEPDAVNAARPVLRGPRRSNAPGATRQIETSYLELKSTILAGRVLRGQYPDAVAQETWSLLTTYQILRTAMADAILHRPRHRSRPGQLQHRAQHRPRPDHPSRRHHRQHQ